MTEDASAVQKWKELAGKQQKAIETLRSSVDKLRAQNQILRQCIPVSNFLSFAQRSLRYIDCARSAVYVAHGVETLPAAHVLAAQAGRPFWCDVIEIPSFSHRSIARNWTPAAWSVLEASTSWYLSQCQGLLTVGETLGLSLAHYGRPVHVLPNQRHAAPVPSSSRLREVCGIAPDCTVLLAASTMTHGLSEILNAVRLLPEHTHLVLLGVVAPASYKEAVVSEVDDLGLQSRVHVLDPVPYDELTEFTAGADLGLVVLSPAVKNHQVSLPNRVFDYISSGVPLITPDIADITKVVNGFDVGKVVRNLTPAGWAQAILIALEELSSLRRNVVRVAALLTWEALEPKLISAFSEFEHVVFIGFNKLHTNNRTRRMALSLANSGKQVVILTQNVESTPEWIAVRNPISLVAVDS